MRPIVRVLIVTDDGLSNGGFLKWTDQSSADAISVHSREFHLGEFISVLTGTSWLGFDLEITKAHRATAASSGMTDAQLKADRGADVIGFRFNQPFTFNGKSQSLADYDMALFFAVKPSNADTSLAPEAEAIAQFMENGGGFFATGDHANLGGELCSQIPRVRSMRRWYFSGAPDSDSPPGPGGEPPAPPPLGPHRHDTTRPGLDLIGQFEDQSDEVPQEIHPALYSAGFGIKSGYPAHRYWPHPLLCSPDGIVTYLPDHMHEGTCEVPDNLAARTFPLRGGTAREYPDYMPASPPMGYVPAPLAPEIVATGDVLAGTRSPEIDSMDHTGSPDPADAVTFGVIGAWDGHRVAKGRVVVDSTWHHFFNINLTGDRFLEKFTLPAAHQQKLHGFYIPDGMGGRVACDEYAMIMWYFRNIIYWLIPAGRHTEYWWYALSDIARTSRFGEELGSLTKGRNYRDFGFEHYLYFGQLAEDYLNKARGACSIFIIHRILYKSKIPWWEWIQEIVDIWDPVSKLRDRGRNEREKLLGAQGVGPRVDVAATLGLGAAMVTAAFAREELRGNDTGRALKAVEALWKDVFAHAVGEYGKSLALGDELQHKVRAVVAAQTKAVN